MGLQVNNLIQTGYNARATEERCTVRASTDLPQAWSKLATRTTTLTRRAARAKKKSHSKWRLQHHDRHHTMIQHGDSAFRNCRSLLQKATRWGLPSHTHSTWWVSSSCNIDVSWSIFVTTHYVSDCSTVLPPMGSVKREARKQQGYWA